MVTALLVGCAAGPAPDVGAGDDGGPDRLAEARAAADAGEYGYALELLMASLDDEPGDPAVARQAAQLALAMDRPDAAARAASRWLALAPESRQAAQVAVVAALRGDDPARAADLLYDKLVGNARDSVRAWVGAVALLAQAEAPEAARRALELALERAEQPEPGLGTYLNSMLAAQEERRDEAWSLAERAYELHPGYERAMWAARLAQRLDRPAVALDYFERALAHRANDRAAAVGQVRMLQQLDRPADALARLAGLPMDDELLYTRGLLQQELGRLAEAGATWQRLASLEGDGAGPRHAWLTGLLAELLEMREQALSWYQRVDGSLQARATLRRAILLGDLGRLEPARPLLAEVRSGSDPDLTERAWLVEGRLLADAGAFDEAIALYSDALTRLPGSTELLYARAMAAVRAEQLPLAEQDLRAIIQNDPDNAVALNALGYTLADLTDRHREALRLIETALELEPDNAAILDSMGWVLYRLDRPEAALPYLQQAAAADPHPEIVAHLVEVLWMLDRRAEAREWVARFGSAHGEEAVFADTLKRLGIE
jgi:tetratricopeptide (TPR) repeat protein